MHIHTAQVLGTVSLKANFNVTAKRTMEIVTGFKAGSASGDHTKGIEFPFMANRRQTLT